MPPLHRRLVLFFFFVTGSWCAYGQPIELYKSFGGARFQRDTLTLTLRQVSQIISIDQQAAAEFKIARTNYNVAGVLGFGGAVLLAVPVVSAISGGEPEWLVAGGGAAMILASIPFSKAFKNRASSALDGYNSRHEKTASNRVKVHFTGNGFVLKF